MKIIVFDTETTSLEKPFVYNIGYVIYDTELDTTLVERDYVVEQIWENIPLFSTAYYAEKRPLYVNRMKGRSVKMEKFGYILQQMKRDIKNFEVVCGYAYNSSFDERVFNFNTDFFKTQNPLDLIPVYDIRGNVCETLITNEFKEFCEKHNLFTESGNYSTTADTLGKYLIDINLEEEHTALSDSLLELEILKRAIINGTEYNKSYNCPKSIPREIEKTLTIMQGKNEIASFKCKGYTIKRTTNTIVIR